MLLRMTAIWEGIALPPFRSERMGHPAFVATEAMAWILLLRLRLTAACFGCGVEGEWGGFCRDGFRVGFGGFLFDGEAVAFAAAAIGMVRVVGFRVDAVWAVATVLVAAQVLLFKDGFSLGNFIALPGEDGAADGLVRGETTAFGGQVGGGDLDAVEIHAGVAAVEEAGVAAVEEAGGEGGEDAGDGDLDGVAVFERGQVEGDGEAALGEVVVAVAFVGESCGTAAASAGANVAAELVHGSPLPDLYGDCLFSMV